MKLMKFVILALAVLSHPAVSSAGLVTYTITVDVTFIGAPGSFPDNQYSFKGPEIDVGTFTADDTSVGPISNLSLTIGGLDIGSEFSNLTENSFDPPPSLLGLSWVGNSPSPGDAGVDFISFQPNYASGFENNTVPPLDPLFFTTQNWQGTFSITAPSTAVVPEPGSLTVLGLGLAGVVGLGWMKKRKAKVVAA